MDGEDHPDHFKMIANPLPERLADWQKQQNEANLASGPSQAYCLTRARLLFACYRKDEVHDPEIYAAAIAAVLADDYELAVVDYVTDPRSGLPSSQKFLPNVAEVREACEVRAATLRRLKQPPLKQRILNPSRPVAAPARKPGQYSYGEFLKWAEENNKKQRAIGAFEPGGYLGPELADNGEDRL